MRSDAGEGRGRPCADRAAFLCGLLLLALAGNAAANELTFIPDAGLRADNASNAAVGLDPDGVVYLHYLDRTVAQDRVASAADGLNFAPATPPSAFAYDSRNTLLPDGTWRRYMLDPRTSQFTSMSSTDGLHFAADPGIRYSAQLDDHGSVGVYDAFADPQGGVVLQYLGDLMGLNNLRRAYSTDGGLTFMFERGDVLGDASLGGGPNSYVDPKTLLLPDGRRRLFTMKQGTIYSFISNSALTSFTLETGARLLPSDFTEVSVHAFFDPVVLQLPDGRYRMYVTASVGHASGPDTQALVSATATPDGVCEGDVSKAKLKLTNFVTSAGDDTFGFSGTLTFASPPTLAPDTTGARVVVNDAGGAAGGAAVVDVSIPIGAYDSATRSGWKGNSTGTIWSYSTRTLLGGVVHRVTLKRPRNAPSSVRFTVSGRAGSYAVPPVSTPLSATMVIDTVTGQCGTATFPGPPPAPSCAFNKSGSTLVCK